MGIRRSTYFSFGSRNAGVLVNFAATLVIARLLTPAEIGVFAVSAAFVMVSQIIRDSGIGNYLIQEQDLTRERVRAAMGVSLLIGGGLGLFIFALAGPLARFYGEPGVEDVLLILVASFVLAPVNAIGMALLRRDLAFGTTFFIETTSNVVWASVAVALAYLGASYYSMALASLAATFTICLLFLILRRDLILIRPSLAEWRRVFGFGSMVTLTHLVNQVGLLAPAFVLGRVAGFSDVAFYNRGASVTRMYNETLGKAAAIVALPAFAQQLRRGAFDKAGYLYATSLITAISWPFFCLVGLMAYPVIRVMFGDQWDAAVPVLQFVAVANFIAAPFLLSSQAMIAVGAVKAVLCKVSIVQGTRVTLVVACAFHSFEAVAAAQIAVSMVSVTVSQFYLRRSLGFTLGDLAKAARPSGPVAALSMAGPVLVALFYPPGPDLLWPPLLLALATGAAGWLVGVFAVGHPIRNEVVILLRKTRSVVASPRGA